MFLLALQSLTRTQKSQTTVSWGSYFLRTTNLPKETRSRYNIQNHTEGYLKEIYDCNPSAGWASISYLTLPLILVVYLISRYSIQEFSFSLSKCVSDQKVVVLVTRSQDFFFFFLQLLEPADLEVNTRADSSFFITRKLYTKRVYFGL